MSKKWMSSGYLRAAPSGKVNHEEGIIEGVSVCRVGEAKGHGVNLDSEFVQTVAAMGGSRKQGLKARFGHPNMCSTALGTFLGRFKNFRAEGDQAKADLFLSNEAKSTPHGDLHSYVLGMADNEPDMFGTSIVFTPGKTYVRGEDGEKVYDYYTSDPFTGMRLTKEEYEDLPVYVECEELHACDTVDDPAANEGLFSKFSQETIAGQITEFLDLNPQVWDAIQINPSIIEALGRYGDKVDEFVDSYRQYREQNGKGHNMTDERTDSEQLEDAVVTEPEATETPEVVVDEVVEQADAVPAEAEVPEAAAAEVVEEDAAMSRADFVAIVDEFGAEVAVQTVRDGGDYASALKLAYSKEKQAREAAEAKAAELAASKGGTPVPMIAAPEKKKEPLFKC